MNIYLDWLCSKGENMQISNVMNENGHISIDSTDILGAWENMNNFMLYIQLKYSFFEKCT